MIVKSNYNNYWLTSTHNILIDNDGLYLPLAVETPVSDELGLYLLTLDGVVEVKEVVVVNTKKPNIQEI